MKNEKLQAALRNCLAFASANVGWLIPILAYLLIVFASCRTPQSKSEHSVIANNSRADSTSRIERERARLLTVPASAASLSLNLKKLADLPAGAKYTGRQGQATVTVEKTGDNGYTVTAACDSFVQLVVEKETEIYRLQRKVEGLEETSREERVEVVSQTTPLRWFLICSGCLFWLCAAAGFIYLKWKRK